VKADEKADCLVAMKLMASSLALSLVVVRLKVVHSVDLKEL